MPIFMGLKTKLTPAKVDCGLACSHRSPDHIGWPLGTAEALVWRMATAFGFPVVPDVKMMSARSSDATST